MVKTMQLVNQQKVKASKYYRITVSVHKDKSLAFISSVLYVLGIKIKENVKHTGLVWNLFFYYFLYVLHSKTVLDLTPLCILRPYVKTPFFRNDADLHLRIILKSQHLTNMIPYSFVTPSVPYKTKN